MSKEVEPGDPRFETFKREARAFFHQWNQIVPVQSLAKDTIGDLMEIIGQKKRKMLVHENINGDTPRKHELLGTSDSRKKKKRNEESICKGSSPLYVCDWTLATLDSLYIGC